MSDAVIRAEEPADYAAVFDINHRAFGRPEEARLVDRLRREAVPAISLVATIDQRLVGHVLFTPVTVHGAGEPVPALGLAPMAVHPTHQRQGIGSRLVEAGLARCRAGGHGVVFVLGHPDFYPRFGFRRAAPLGLRYEALVPDDAFMVVELIPRTLAGLTGVVSYLPAFAGV